MMVHGLPVEKKGRTAPLRRVRELCPPAGWTPNRIFRPTAYRMRLSGAGRRPRGVGDFGAGSLALNPKFIRLADEGGFRRSGCVDPQAADHQFCESKDYAQTKSSNHRLLPVVIGARRYLSVVRQSSASGFAVMYLGRGRRAAECDDVVEQPAPPTPRGSCSRGAVGPDPAVEGRGAGRRAFQPRGGARLPVPKHDQTRPGRAFASSIELASDRGAACRVNAPEGYEKLRSREGRFGPGLRLVKL